MIKKMYAIRDAKAEAFLNPWFKVTHGEAERDFNAAVNNEETTLAKYPEDFDLYYLGDYDDNSGKLKSLDSPQHIVKAVQLVRQKGPQAVQ